MRKMRVMLSVAVGMVMAAVECRAQSVPEVPTVQLFSEYKGSSFRANWEAVTGAQSYLLDVFSRAAADSTLVEDFGGVNAKGGVIDAESPGYPAGWEINATKALTEDGKRKIMFCESGEYIMTPEFDGPIAHINIVAHLADATGVTDDNATVLRLDFYDGAGRSVIHVESYMSYFLRTNTLPVFETIGKNWEAITAVRFGMEHRDGHTMGDVVIDRFEIESIRPEYALKGKETKGTSLTVSDLDSEKVYWYACSAKNSRGTSHRSELVRVDGLLAPETLSATDVATDSYTAEWSAAPKAERYVVTNYVVREETGKVAMMEDKFSNASKGTFEEPVMLETTDEADLYADNKGWGGNLMVVAEGALGADKPVSFYMRGWLETPPTDLSACGGTYSVYVRARGMKGDALTIYPKGEYDPSTAHVMPTFKSDGGVVEQTWTCRDGRRDLVLSIEPKSNKFLIEEIRFTQTSTQPLLVKKLDRRVEVEGKENTTCRFEGLEEGQEYGYVVRTRRTDFLGSDDLSEYSEICRVKLEAPSGVVAADACRQSRVVMTGETLVVDVEKEGVCEVFNASGVLIYRMRVIVGRYEFRMPAKGRYIVRVVND